MFNCTGTSLVCIGIYKEYKLQAYSLFSITNTMKKMELKSSNVGEIKKFSDLVTVKSKVYLLCAKSKKFPWKSYSVVV